MDPLLASHGGPGSFAERLRRLGAEFDLEARQTMEANVQRSQREMKMLRDEVEWLQGQLESERQQSAARLGLCAEMKRQLEDVQELHRLELEAREYWQQEFNAKEEQYSLLEAKLAGIALVEAEAAEEAAAAAAESAARAAAQQAEVQLDVRDEIRRRSTGGLSMQELCEEAEADEDDRQAAQAARADEEDVEDKAQRLVVAAPGTGSDGEFHGQDVQLQRLDAADAPAVDACLQLLEGGAGSTVEQQLQGLNAEGLHALLLAASQKGEGSSVLIHRIVRLWVCRLLNCHGGASLRAAVQSGNSEALQALISLGGASTVVAATVPSAPPGGAQASLSVAALDRHELSSRASMDGSLLCDCALRGDVNVLNALLEHLRGAGRTVLASIRKARDVASKHCQAQAAGILATHLVVELSLLGNARYRAGEFDGAITCYREAIELCDLHSAEASASNLAANMNAAGCSRENLVRLRYNLARAFHRSDRWNEAREQASAVLALDRDYVNAYALRAQAAMAALDWEAARSDWDRLALISERGGSLPSVGQEVARAWRRRREECCRQLAQDHYEVLGLPRLSGIEAIRRCYRDLARRWHPDKHQNRPQDIQERAARKFNRIREAYEVLGDETLKRAYDTELLLLEARPLSPGNLSTLGRAGAGATAPAGGAAASAAGSSCGYGRGGADTSSSPAWMARPE
eukprot:TRINITY_DN31714_c2_g1_i1.p1 TRINITY_DN31714_c2_g1~~TRINITY_DN31714_c2_g1_i1.p1  ORF type:complete len:692 (-),score=169.30 TRINITY_DN31714_c2_g1_i1:39-2114(-)